MGDIVKLFGCKLVFINGESVKVYDYYLYYW